MSLVTGIRIITLTAEPVIMIDEPLPSYTPQRLNDILPIYHPDSTSASLHTYILRQEDTTSQSLLPRDDRSEAPRYHIKIFATGGFMNKKPHIIITKTPSAMQQPTMLEPVASESSAGRRRSLFRHSPSPPLTPYCTRTTKNPRSESPKSPTSSPVVEARFEIHGTGTNITYLSPVNNDDPPAYSMPRPLRNHGTLIQRLELYDSPQQILRTTISGAIHYWQPHPGNKAVVELVDGFDEVVARFTYQLASNPESRQNSATSAGTPALSITEAQAGGRERPKKGTVFTSFDLGNLELVAARIPNAQAREEILCSCVVAVERARRRAANCGLIKGRMGASPSATAGGLGGAMG